MRRLIAQVSLFALALHVSACGGCGTDDPNNTENTTPGNTAPVAVITVDDAAEVGETITASGADSSDEDGDELSFTWTLSAPDGSSASLDDTSAEEVSFTADEAGEYTLTLQVSDGADSSEVVDATITVTEPAPTNEAPAADAGADQTVTLGDAVTLDGSGSSDPDGDDLTFTWMLTTVPAGSAASIDDPAAAQPTFTPDVAGVYELDLEVSDGELTDNDTVIITVEEDEPENNAPVADAGADQTVTLGDAVTLDGAGSSDPDGDDLTFTWSLPTDPSNGADMLDDVSAEQPTFTPSALGDYVFELTVEDPDGEASTDSVTITVEAPPNNPPVADAGTDQTVTVGDDVMLDGTGSTDVEDDAAMMALTYDWVIAMAPAGSTASLDDRTSPTPAFNADAVGVFILELTVTDSAGDTGMAMVRVTAQPLPNNPPVADAGGNQMVTAGTPVTLDGSGSTDVEDDAAMTPLTYNWTITSQPAGANVSLSDNTAETPTFTPTVEGNYVFLLTVTDSQNTSDSDTVTVVVTSQPNTPPTADAGADQVVAARAQVTLDASGSTDAEDDAAMVALSYDWAVLSEPAGSLVNLSDVGAEMPTFTPLVGGVYTFEVTVTDAGNATDTDTVTITVTNSPPVADAGTDQTVSQGNPVVLDASGSTDTEDDGAGVALSYQWTVVSEPVGANTVLMNDSSASANFFATTIGTYTFEVSVTDSGTLTSTDQVDVVVTAPNTPPQADAGEDQTVLANTQVTLDGSGSTDVEDDAAMAPLTYSWTVIGEPMGASTTLSDAAAEMPTFTPTVAGAYTFDLTVTDSANISSTDTVTITVVDPASDCLIISEYIEGSSNNKAIELYNCGASDVDLTAYEICNVTNANTTCTSATNLTGTLAAGDTLQICNSNLDTMLLPMGVTCDLTSSVTFFNGNDRVALFVELDGVSGLDTGDVVVDAFGELAVDPGSIWSDTGYSRCDFTPYDGTGAFVVTDYYAEAMAQDDFSDFGAAPTEGCPVVNDAPMADAGADQTVVVNTQVTLDGSGSTDVEDDASMTPLTYSWTVTSEPAGANTTLSDNTAEMPTFTPTVDGTYTFELTVTDSMGASSTDAVTITVNPVLTPTGCVIISEYIEGSASNKAIELHNCGMSDVDLTNYRVCLLSNGSAVCSNELDLTGTLAAGDTLQICNSGLDTMLLSMGVTCTETSGVANFNGNDALLVYFDGDATGDLSAADTRVDAFGETGVDPGAGTWANTGYNRCDLTPYDGVGAFVVTDYYTEAMSQDDFSDFGTAPTPGCPGPNNAPMADAGADQAVTTGTQVTLDGSNSTDVEDDAAMTALTYSWAVTSEPAGANTTLSDSSAEMPMFTPTVDGAYTFELTVVDSAGASSTDTVTITANPPANNAPVADAGVDQTVVVNTQVTLDGSGSTDVEDDASMTPLTYSWTVTSEPAGANTTLSDSAAEQPTFTPTVDGTYTFELTVTDSAGDSSTDSVTVTVDPPPNTPPTADAGADQTVAVNTQVTLDGSGSTDAEDDASMTPLTYSWTVISEPAGANTTLSDNTAEMPTFTPTVAGAYTFDLTVTDSAGDSDLATVTITVVDPASDCLIISEYIEGSSNNKAIELYNCGGSDIELASYHICLISNADTTCSTDLDLTGTLFAGDTLQICNPNLTTTLLPMGVTCDETDGVAGFNGNDRLLLYFDGDASGGFSAGDVRVDAFGETAVDPGSVWANTGYNRCDFTPYDGTSTFVVSNYYAEAMSQDDFSDFGTAPTESCGATNNAPAADAGSNQAVTTGTQVTLDGSGSTDVEDDATMTPLTYSWAVTSEPAGANTTLSDSAAEMPTFTPTVDGTYTFELTVTDSAGASSTDTVSVTAQPMMMGSDCLIISEYIEGSSSNKAIELYNCGSTSIGLSSYHICLISNSSTTCSTDLDLTGQLAAGETLQICNPSLTTSLLPMGVTCDETSGVANFNGNDRLLLYRDEDASGGFNTGDTRVDAFGETAVDPGTIWGNRGYNRCDFTPYDGTTAFTATDYYVENGTVDDFSGFGTAPMSGCP